MLLDFEKYAMKGNEFLNKLSANLGIDDRKHAARILRSTFRVLRNHITPEESLQLISQLPMALKSIYVDGWKLSDHKKVRNIEEFLSEIIQEEGNDAWRDFSSKEEVINSVSAVLETLRDYVSASEMDQALGTLPKKIRVKFESLKN
jgi:uncharacterized protein (DUF2267 family)